MEQVTTTDEVTNFQSDSNSFSLINYELNEESESFDEEIDPFASELEDEKTEDSKCGKAIVDTETSCTVSLNVKIPSLWDVKSKIIKVDRLETLEKVLEKLKNEFPAAFDSQKTFDFRIGGRIYLNGELLVFGADDDEIADLKLESELMNELLLIHDLLKITNTPESFETEEFEENGLKEEDNSFVEEEDHEAGKILQNKEIAANLNNDVNKKSLISRFKNLWTVKDRSPKNEPVTLPKIDFKCPTSLEALKIDEATGLPEFIEDVLNYLGGNCDASDNNNKNKNIQEGLFRLSGTFTRIKILQDRLDSTGERLKTFNLGPEDCHNVTSLFKQFLRNLPEPLLSFELYEGWRGLGCWTAFPKVGIRIAKFLIGKLPELNRRVLKALVKFLRNLLDDTEMVQFTRMNAGNYGTVIGPNLLWHSKEDRKSRDNATLGLSLQSSTLASQIFTFILQNYDKIMDDELDVNENERVIAYGRILYDFDFESDDNIEENGNDNENSIPNIDDKSENVNLPYLVENQIIFITGIDDFVDGWWRGFIINNYKKKNNENTFNSSRFPSNYVEVLGQCDDSEFLN